MLLALTGPHECVNNRHVAAKLEARVSKHDAEIAAIRKLIITGMKLLSATQADLRKIAAAHIELAAAHRETERTLTRFIRSMERGTAHNGHSKSNLQ
jgi:septal ring factor EnvC (AmiA/AmiB activator)